MIPRLYETGFLVCKTSYLIKFSGGAITREELEKMSFVEVVDILLRNGIDVDVSLAKKYERKELLDAIY
jgi:hypothetical protein